VDNPEHLHFGIPELTARNAPAVERVRSGRSDLDAVAETKMAFDPNSARMGDQHAA
jgi:hypothetical protein